MLASSCRRIKNSLQGLHYRRLFTTIFLEKQLLRDWEEVAILHWWEYWLLLACGVDGFMCWLIVICNNIFLHLFYSVVFSSSWPHVMAFVWGGIESSAAHYGFRVRARRAIVRLFMLTLEFVVVITQVLGMFEWKYRWMEPVVEWIAMRSTCGMSSSPVSMSTDFFSEMSYMVSEDARQQRFLVVFSSGSDEIWNLESRIELWTAFYEIGGVVGAGELLVWSSQHFITRIWFIR